MMEQRVSLITLGVRDMAQAAAFYNALGWTRVETDDGPIVYDLIGQSLGLYPLQALADEVGVPVVELGRGACTLAHNVREEADVATLLRKVEAAGGKVLKPASDVFWGGHHGYFADPEGHIWEVAFNPFSKLSAEGAFRWNGYG